MGWGGGAQGGGRMGIGKQTNKPCKYPFELPSHWWVLEANNIMKWWDSLIHKPQNHYVFNLTVIPMLFAEEFVYITVLPAELCLRPQLSVRELLKCYTAPKVMQRDWRTSMKGEQFPLGWKVSSQVQNTEHFNPFSVSILDCLPERMMQSQERAMSVLASFPTASKSWWMGGSEKNGRLIDVAVQGCNTDALISYKRIHHENRYFFIFFKGS